jgi:perosamine synthetase
MIPDRVIPHSKPSLGPEEISAVSCVLKSDQIAQGPVVKGFEDEMAQSLGVKGAVAVSSGTAAVHLGLLGMGIRKGDEVLLPSYVCTSLLNAIHYTGASARLVDVDPHSFNMDVASAKKAVTKRSRAIIVPHLFGLPADLDILLSLGLPVIEACAQSLGATYHGKFVGSFGTFSFVSFYATKLMTTGEGGMLFTNSSQLLKRVRSLRAYDQNNRYGLSFNYKMTDLQAALGRVQLKKLPDFLAKRRALAKRYHQALDALSIEQPVEYPDRSHCYYRYVVKVKGSVEHCLKEFEKRGIACRRPVFRPLHRYLQQRGFLQTNRVFRRALSLPLYPSLSDEEAEAVMAAATQVLK